MTREYYNSREKFTPEVGITYENLGGGSFKCLEISWLGAHNCKMVNIRSGWTFIAYGCGIYEDGRIDWEYSTDGYFQR